MLLVYCQVIDGSSVLIGIGDQSNPLDLNTLFASIEKIVVLTIHFYRGR